jgi:preprotein translocase subunit SecA
VIDLVNAQETRFSRMTDRELRGQTAIFKGRLAQGETLDDILPEAFAVVREASKRVVGMRPFDVQIVGGYVLHKGNIAEMVTGEGKTLVATLPAYLNALPGRGVHVVTVNDYLARRDAEWMGSIYEFLGLSVGLIQQNMSPPERQVGYRSDITYGTNNEFGFDYLRDNMAVRPETCVQRVLNYAIVDEVDSILIDEARTPLIISGRPEKSSDLYVKIDDVVRRMRVETHYTLDEKHSTVIITDEGMEHAERLLGVDNLFADETIGMVHMIEQSIKAHSFFKRDDEYMIRDGEVLIIDEFTGRTMEGRRYSDGLHQALEAKERVPIRFETQTMASISYQNYFRLYNKLAGMTGTAMTEAQEFQGTYGLDVYKIPTNLPLVREDQTDLIFATEKGKFNYVVEEIKRISDSGRPVLVGTVSIEKSELVAQLLDDCAVSEYQVLNAKHHEREAAIVANAGKRGAITIATNMAGRGTDIKLAEGVRELGGLYIIGTERHESRRIDNQLRGRCGRQGDPGTTSFYVSLEDEVARLFGGDKVKKMITWFGGEELDQQPLNQRMVSRTIERAQKQVEEYYFEMRKHLLQYDEVMDKQRKYIYAMRRAVLDDKDISGQIQEMFENVIGDAIDEYAPMDKLPDDWDLEGLEAALYSRFGFEVDPHAGDGLTVEESVLEQVREKYSERERQLADEIRAQVQGQIGTEDGHIDYDKMARKRMHDYEKMVLLRTVDDKWIDHLYEMDYLRESVRLRAFGQKDPLLEYKSEGYELFQSMVKSIEEIVTQSLFHLTDPEVRKKREQSRRAGTLTVKEDPFAKLHSYQYVAADKEADRSFASRDTSRFQLGGQAAAAQSAPGTAATKEAPKRQPIRVTQKVKPNDPCPCGSGKKFKKCCGSISSD